MERLGDLRLAYNRMSQLPDDIGQIKRLRFLDVSGNAFAQLPQCIPSANTLRFLLLSSNRLQALPGTIGHLDKLEELRIDHNQIRQLPPDFPNLTCLRRLDICANPFEDLPVYIPPSLEILFIDELLFRRAAVETKWALAKAGKKAESQGGIKHSGGREAYSSMASGTGREKESSTGTSVVRASATHRNTSAIRSKSAAATTRRDTTTNRDGASTRPLTQRFRDVLRLDALEENVHEYERQVLEEIEELGLLIDDIEARIGSELAGSSLPKGEGSGTSAVDDEEEELQEMNLDEGVSKEKWRRRKEERKRGLKRLPPTISSQSVVLVPELDILPSLSSSIKQKEKKLANLAE
uniref:L domain-like protein n=1 Tax=Palpitomonas bilix TaxID=652834 RepID=A0A7S3LT65_9EUKA|mmetsp:Transcript_45547/g.117715  ORF Transcript_45547/g.117715 Transcript_45547/m.117715 type:complete len:352 (+) Transcript_45547:295-1350(+)